MKKTIFFIIICVLIWDFISTQSTVIPSFIPINEGIPDNELSRLSLEVLPIISHKFKIQIFSDRIRIDSRPKCYNSQGFDGKDTVKVSVFFFILPYLHATFFPQGCEIGVYICDHDFHKQCLWVHKSHCQCSSPGKF
ncbi:hypothetical protein [Cryptosporidium parvum Iowa II]|uniref:Uncharacterized protein n=1 Tax=Cryptosporidium parvum (strain Iowa II) TaxID=353152 RepID=Q5CYJ2_CRYPI|nr:hypothetical protein [Cryptosporidium parvum Iowa II]EAK90243.1 hypothetical protein cgd7_2120 [Cryptosporidium parvum Iowa II]